VPEPSTYAQNEIIDAALAVIDDQAASDVLPSTRAVAARSHRARNTAVGAFRPATHHSVLRHLASSSSSLRTPAGVFAHDDVIRRVEFLGDVLPATRPEMVLVLVRQLSVRHFHNLAADDRGLRRRLLFTAAAMSRDASSSADDEVRDDFADALRMFYAGLDDRYVERYEELLRRWGKEVIPSLDMRQLTRTLTALADGLLLRYSVDDDSTLDAAAETYGAAAEAILVSMITPAVVPHA